MKKKKLKLTHIKCLRNYNKLTGISLSITPTMGTLSSGLVEKLKIKKDDKVIISYDNLDFYFAVLPFESLIQGYNVTYHSSYTFRSVKFNEFLKVGIYDVDIMDPVYSEDTDWYLLKKR